MFACHPGDIADQVDIALACSIGRARYQLHLIVQADRVDEKRKGGVFPCRLAYPCCQRECLSKHKCGTKMGAMGAK